MQTKSPFSCRDRSPSDANVTGLNNRRDASSVRNNRRVEARSGAWCRTSTNVDITEPSILNNSQEGSNVVLLQPQSRPANQENPAHPNYGCWDLSATSSPNGRKKIYSWNPTETALWSSNGFWLLQPLFSISENRKPITITLITQYNQITNVWFSHEGFGFKFSGDINTHYYHHTYLSLSPGRSVSGGSRWSVHFIRIKVIFESVFYCVYLLQLEPNVFMTTCNNRGRVWDRSYADSLISNWTSSLGHQIRIDCTKSHRFIDGGTYKRPSKCCPLALATSKVQNTSHIWISGAREPFLMFPLTPCW